MNTAITVPWGTLFGLLFMTMGPIRAIAVFSIYGESDEAPAVRSLAWRSIVLSAIAFCVALFMGDGALQSWGVGMPALIAAAGAILFILSLQMIMFPAPQAPTIVDPASVTPAQVCFPGLFPPLAVAIPVIFAAAAPGTLARLIILAIGLFILLLDWLAMRYAKRIIKTIGPVPLKLFGAVFGILQAALGIEFIIDAWRLLEEP
ncbi:hypothetical protein Maes01_01524 [Microbulbifer aestuariivivens]|uniref:UPF0056 membrane protein n=1 Tax=Microbulbifer aestuariivivens TaxID=1908308 RepID=A0ABP9WPK4_9GAMM